MEVAPLALYAGWLSAASLVSIGLLGAGYGVLFGQVGWAYVSIIAATTVGVAMQSALGRAPLYGVAVIWALIAIAVHNGTGQIGVTIVALIGAVIVGAATIGAVRRSRKTPNF